MQEYGHDPEDPEAEIIVLQRLPEVGGGLALDTAHLDQRERERLRATIVGQTVSTGDRFAGFEIIEIVPPDEPALVTETTMLEFA